MSAQATSVTSSPPKLHSPLQISKPTLLIHPPSLALHPLIPPARKLPSQRLRLPPSLLGKIQLQLQRHHLVVRILHHLALAPQLVVPVLETALYRLILAGQEGYVGLGSALSGLQGAELGLELGELGLQG